MKRDLPLFDEPAPVHRDAHDTEYQPPTRKQLVGQRLAVLRELVNAGDRGLTDNELEFRLGWKPLQGAKRRVELATHGYVVATTERRATPSGRKSIVWKALPAGREALGQVASA